MSGGGVGPCETRAECAGVGFAIVMHPRDFQPRIQRFLRLEDKEDKD